MNRLYYGDNLDVLRRYVGDESVDLVYLDPPFNSSRSYNVLFAEKDGHRAAAQIRAFEDTWSWDAASSAIYHETVEGGGKVSEVMQAFRLFLGDSDMLAYLAMMAPRLVELHRVLKPTGSLYLHCDPTASHYLKLLLDAVFGPVNFRNEIAWKRSGSHNDSRSQFGAVTDRLLFYGRSSQASFYVQHVPHNAEYIKQFFRHQEADGRVYKLDSIISPNPRPNLIYEYKGYPPPPRGWSVSRERMKRLDAEGRLHFPQKKGGRIMKKVYLDELDGIQVSDFWADIKGLAFQSAERLGYPTQKPEALLERIIMASSKEGDVVLDPFCGCGTAIIVAERLNRCWIGIDITHLAITLIRHRLRDRCGDSVSSTYDVIGEPVSLPDAEVLAAEDPYQFQWWALGLVGARPVEQKKGADKGIDGRLYFHDEARGGKTKQIILSVKAGGTGAAHIRDLRGVIEREGAEIGVLLTMQQPTAPMRKEAASAGFYESAWGRHPRLQILTIQDLLDGKKIDYPPARQVDRTFKKAPRFKKVAEHQLELGADS